MKSARLMLASVACLALTGIPASASITLNPFTDPHPTVSGGTIGFTYAGNKFVGSAYGSDHLYSTNLNGGGVQVFAPTFMPSGPSVEHFVAASLGYGGWANYDVYVAEGNSIIHINNAGTTFNTFVSGLNGGVRGIAFDTVGTFNNDMLVTTTSGSIYRVTAGGVSSLLVNVGEDTEGLDVAPLGGTLGSFNGQLLVASEGSGAIRAISNTGVVTVLAHVSSAEELSVVPLNLGASGNPLEGFYAANFTPNVLKADANQFAGMQGDIIVTGETTHLLTRLHFNGTGFVATTEATFPNQPEDGIFVTAAVLANAAPEPSTIASAALAGIVGIVAAIRKRRASR